MYTFETYPIIANELFVFRMSHGCIARNKKLTKAKIGKINEKINIANMNEIKRTIKRI